MPYLLVTPDQYAEIRAINGRTPDHIRLTPIALADGRLVLNDDLLTDCGPGGTWAEYAEALASLTAVDVQESDWPQIPPL